MTSKGDDLPPFLSDHIFETIVVVIFMLDIYKATSMGLTPLPIYKPIGKIPF
jgi:hypothetical protein